MLQRPQQATEHCLETLPSVHGETSYGLFGATHHIEAMTAVQPENGVLIAFTVRVQKFLREGELAGLMSIAKRNGFAGCVNGRMVDYDVLYFRNEVA